MEEEPPPQRCQFWIPNKRRFCANFPLPHSLFCGNHNPASEAQRVLCPVDPSHSVLKVNLESHVKRCPLRKQVQALEAQTFYEKGINAGGGDDDDEHVSSEAKRNQIHGLTVPEFLDLVRKINSVHSSLRSDLDLPVRYSTPEACGAWLKGQRGERQLPFQEKHVLQQASILGNMEAFGVLQKKPAGAGEWEGAESGGSLCVDSKDVVAAVVEFGAGRGYLTHMLADCYGIERVFLVERRSYKLKADRSLRQKQSMNLERLRIDIEDLNLSAVEALKGLPYLAIGKHLCGAATDSTMRCCLPEQYNKKKWIQSSSCYLRGLALATCCHHLC